MYLLYKKTTYFYANFIFPSYLFMANGAINIFLAHFIAIKSIKYYFLFFQLLFEAQEIDFSSFKQIFFSQRWDYVAK